MSAAHTPGPWRTVPARDASGDIGIKADGPVNVHAEVFAEFWAKGEFRHAEAEANARLIASSPIMLAALHEWACPSCGGAKTYKQRSRVPSSPPAPRGFEVVPCKVCEGTGLHPTASAAIASATGAA